LTNEKVIFTGKNRLLKRPQKVYEKLFNENGLHFIQNDEYIEIQGALKAKKYTLEGNISSQFISGLLFTLPLLDNDSQIHILPPFESRSYIDLTIQMLFKFGIRISWLDDLTLFIPGNQKYCPHNEVVEGDFSQFAFFGVLGAINHDLDIVGMDNNSLQGDKQILDILNDFGCHIVENENKYHVSFSNLVSHDIDLQNCPDLGPILCILAMFSKGDTRIYHASRLRLKESDRILAMVSECKKMGCLIEASEDEMVIHGGSFHAPVEALSGWKDHRIVMACAIALSKLGGVIEGCEAVSKSYPSFFDDLRSVGIEVVCYD
ncbi:MAG: 3-phosphoshikimate 1-carboxyvinyltransferase, partial [Traorella sp.]